MIDSLFSDVVELELLVVIPSVQYNGPVVDLNGFLPRLLSLVGGPDPHTNLHVVLRVALVENRIGKCRLLSIGGRIVKRLVLKVSIRDSYWRL